MRRTLIGLVAAGAIVVAGCSDADDSGAGASDDGGGSGGSGEFCATFEQLVADASSEDADDGATRETLTNLEPPSEIEEAWDAYLPVVLRSEEVDRSDPEAVAQYQQEASQVADAGQTVNQYLAEDCGIESSTGGDPSGGGTGPNADPGAGGGGEPGTGAEPPAPGGEPGQ